MAMYGGIFIAFILSHNKALLVSMCVDFQGLPNDANLIVIANCVGKLLVILKGSGQRSGQKVDEEV